MPTTGIAGKVVECNISFLTVLKDTVNSIRVALAVRPVQYSCLGKQGRVDQIEYIFQLLHHIFLASNVSNNILILTDLELSQALTINSI